MRFLPILRPYGTHGKCGYFIKALSHRDKLLVENGLPNNPRPVGDSIWMEVIGEIAGDSPRTFVRVLKGRNVYNLRRKPEDAANHNLISPNGALQNRKDT